MKTLFTRTRRAAYALWPWLAVAALLIGLSPALLGCSQPPLERSEPPKVGQHADDIQDRAEDQITRSEKIDQHADEAAKVPGAEKPAAAIKAENQEIRNDAHAIHASAKDLRGLQARIDALVKERDKALARAEKAESAASQWEWRVLAGIKIASGLAIAVSIALMALGTLRTAIPTFIAAAVFIGSIFVSVAIQYQMLIGIGCGVVVVGAIAWELWVKKRGIAEIVETVDETLRGANDKLPVDLAKNAELAQSAITKKLIDGAQGNGPLNKIRRWLGGVIAGQKVAVKV